jgi:DNA-binding NarL/FixJ family response regulator
MIRVLVAAASPVSQAGLRALLEGTPEYAVVAVASAGELVELALESAPDVILWQISADEDAGGILRSLNGHCTVLLTSNTALDRALEMIRAGARGVLPHGASAEQIRMALSAVAAGLAVFVPESLDEVPASRMPSTLTARETEVLRMIAEGLANKEIAWRLGISEHTVKFHVSALLGKLGAGSRAEAISAGIRQGAIML